MLHHAIAEGMTKDQFMDLPTPINQLDHIQAVPADHFFGLHELLDQKLGPGFSIRVGQEMKIEDYGVLGLSWKTCSWAGEIFDRSERYFKMLSNTYVFKVQKRGDISYVYLFRDSHHRRGIALSNEATFSATVVVLQAITETNIIPVEVSFTHSPPSSMDSYLKAFNCQVIFDQPDNYIAYRAEDLKIRTAKADASINQFLVARVEEETQGMEVHYNRLVVDVEQLIRNALPSGIPSIEYVSDYMSMSKRTLTRRLSEGGVSFRDLIRNTQENISKQLLKQSSRSIGEIAFETGFSDQSAFNRAFKRWTGQSPVEFRKTPQK